MAILAETTLPACLPATRIHHNERRRAPRQVVRAYLPRSASPIFLIPIYLPIVIHVLDYFNTAID